LCDQFFGHFAIARHAQQRILLLRPRQLPGETKPVIERFKSARRLQRRDFGARRLQKIKQHVFLSARLPCRCHTAITPIQHDKQGSS
jgi:hypothetical protein